MSLGQLLIILGRRLDRADRLELGPPNPQTAPQQILELPEEALFVLKDFGGYRVDRARSNAASQHF